MHCPNCDSENVASLGMIYGQGTHMGTTITTDYRGHISESQGLISTPLAAASAPPLRKGFGATVAICIGGGVLAIGLFIAAATGWQIASVVVFAVFAVMAAIILVPAIIVRALASRWNRTMLPALASAYRATWRCLACGTRFLVTPAAG